MKAVLEDVIAQLDQVDKQKVLQFSEELLQSKKYRKLREELDSRREEIRLGKSLKNEDFWNGL